MSDDQTPPPSAPPTTPPASRSARKFWFIVAFFLVTWVFAVQGVPRLFPQYFARGAAPVAAVPADDEEDAPLRHEIARLRSDQDALRKRIAELEEKQPAAPDVAMRELRDRMNTLEAKANAPAAPRLNDAALDDLRGRIEASERELKELRASARGSQSAGWRKLGMLSALHELEEKALSGRPFQPELDSLRTLAEGEPAILDMLSALNPLAIKGVDSEERLRASFNEAVRKALAQPSGNGSVGDKIAGQLGRLVTIRKIGAEQTGSSDEAIIARAEAKLGQGEIDEALKELQALSPKAAQFFAPWLASARQTSAVRQQMGELSHAVLQSIHRIPTEPGAP